MHANGIENKVDLHRMCGPDDLIRPCIEKAPGVLRFAVRRKITVYKGPGSLLSWSISPIESPNDKGTYRLYHLYAIIS